MPHDGQCIKVNSGIRATEVTAETNGRAHEVTLKCKENPETTTGPCNKTLVQSKTSQPLSRSRLNIRPSNPFVSRIVCFLHVVEPNFGCIYDVCLHLLYCTFRYSSHRRAERVIMLFWTAVGSGGGPAKQDGLWRHCVRRRLEEQARGAEGVHWPPVGAGQRLR